MSTTERDLFGAASPRADMRAITTAIQPVPPATGPSPRQLLATPEPGPTPQAQTLQAPASPPTAPAPGTTTTPVLSTPVLSQVQGNETVQGQLRQLLSEGSPVLNQARDQAKIYSAGRGLQNSTLAAQAGEQAVISAATPIAATDAATFAQRALVNVNAQNEFGGRQQGFEHQTQLNEQQIRGQKELSTQDHVQRIAEQAQAGDINSRLQLEQAGYNSSLSAQENMQRLQQLAKEGDIQASLALQSFNYSTLLAAQKQGFDIELGNQQFQQNQQLLIDEYAQRSGLSAQEAQQEINRLNEQHENTLAEIQAQATAAGGADSARWARDLQQGYLNAVTQRQMAASQEVQAIYTTQGLSSAQQTQAVNVAQTRLRSDLAAIAAYFQQTPGWPTSPNVPTPTVPGPVPAPLGTPTYPGTDVPMPNATPPPPPGAIPPSPQGRPNPFRRPV